MTILGARSLEGMIATRHSEVATDADTFPVYGEHEQVLCPVLFADFLQVESIVPNIATL